MQEQQRQRAGDEHQRHIKAHLGFGEGCSEGPAYRQHHALACQRDHIRGDLKAHPDAHQQNPHGTHQPAGGVALHRNALNGPDRCIGEGAEDQGHRQLDQLDGVIAAAQQQDLQQNQRHVHGDGGGAHGERVNRLST